MKKGVSPFIASTLLVGLAIILGSVVFSFTTLENLKLQQNAQKLYSQPLFVRFSTIFSSENCGQEGALSCGVNDEKASCYTILVENKESFTVAYYVWTEGNRGVSVCGPIELETVTSKLVNVYFDEQKVGSPPDLKAKIIPAKP